MILRRIGVLSVGKVMGSLYALVGLIFGLIFSLVAMMGAAIGSFEGGDEAWIGAIFGIGAIFFLPVFYGLMGFLGGLLMSALYNLVAKIVGGVELHLE